MTTSGNDVIFFSSGPDSCLNLYHTDFLRQCYSQINVVSKIMALAGYLGWGVHRITTIQD